MLDEVESAQDAAGAGVTAATGESVSGPDKARPEPDTQYVKVSTMAIASTLNDLLTLSWEAARIGWRSEPS